MKTIIYVDGYNLFYGCLKHTDLSPALQAIRDDFGRKVKIGVIIPIRQETVDRPPNAKLSSYADWTRKYITNNELSDIQLPELIPTKRKPIKKTGVLVMAYNIPKFKESTRTMSRRHDFMLFGFLGCA